MNTKIMSTELDTSMSLYLTTEAGQLIWSFPGEVIENLRSMVTRIGKNGNFPASLALMSALRGEGVTYLTQALATILAHDLSARVCLVDLNWWRPSSIPWVAPENPGIAGVLAGKADLNDVIIPTGWKNLALLPAGKLARQERPVWSRSQELKMLFDKLRNHYDTLILDVPAILETNDSVPLSALASACCLVVRQGETHINDVQQALDEIDHLNILGVVMNCGRIATPVELFKLISQ
jgi:Mrp family chromosome partitioning ATPase